MNKKHTAVAYNATINAHGIDVTTRRHEYFETQLAANRFIKTLIHKNHNKDAHIQYSNFATYPTQRVTTQST